MTLRRTYGGNPCRRFVVRSPKLRNPHQTRVPTFPQRLRRRYPVWPEEPTPLKLRALSDSCTEPNNDGTFSVSNFSFSTNSSCFVSSETESGSFLLSGNFNRNVTGEFQFTVMSGSPSGNRLTLPGTANGKISGTWSLTGGTGCTGSGNFTMTKG
jgi:hypothetical protein